MDQFEIPAALIKEMVDHAQAEYPKECCGFLAGPAGAPRAAFRLRNAHPDPVMRYRADSRDVLRAYKEIDDNGWEVVCVYHSHTHTPAYPSQTDVEESQGLPDAVYALVGLSDRGRPEVRAYRLNDGGVTELSIAEVAPAADA